MIKRVRSFIDHLDINKTASFVIFSYFVLCLLPYVFSFNASLYTLFSSLVVHLLLRMLAFVLLLLFLIVCWFKERFKINYLYLSFAGLLVLTSLISCFISKKSYISFHDNSPYYIFTTTEIHIGYFDIFAYYLSNIVDILCSVIFIFVFPKFIRKDSLKLLLLTVFFLMVFECFYSIVFEFNEYLSLFSSNGNGYSGYDINISGTFISKNDFGAFLITGLIAERFLSLRFQHNKYMKIILQFGRFIIIFVTILSLCKTALFSVILILLIDIICRIAKILKERNKKGITGLLIGVFLLIVAISVLIIFNDISIIHKINVFVSDKLNDAFVKSFTDRILTWSISFTSVTGINILIGIPKAILPSIIMINSGNTYIYPHNGFVYQYMNYGVLGIAFLVYAFYLVIRRIHYAAYAIDKRIIITTLLSGIVFMMTETEILLISSSELVFVFNVILCHNYMTISRKDIESVYAVVEI